MSLAISLTCALLATSIQQWTRRYIKNTQPKRCPPHERARKRAFFADGMNEILIPLPRAVEGMPALLHLAVFLFFAGLLIFLFNTNNHVAIPVTSWIALFLLVYICVTLMPIVRPSSPYHTPFSSLACFLCARLGYVCFSCLTYMADQANLNDFYKKSRELRRHCHRWMLGSRKKVVQEEILDLSSEIDLRILDWILHALRGDDSLERFFQSIPGFFGSDLVQNLRKYFSFDLSITFMETFIGFLNRTLSPNSAFRKNKARRLKIYEDVMKVIPGPTIPSKFLDQAVKNGQVKAPKPIERGEAFALWFENTEEKMSKYVRESVIGILFSIPASERDGRWETLAAQQFHLSDRTDLQYHVNSQNDDVLLYLLNLVISEATFADSSSASSAKILSTLSTTVCQPSLFLSALSTTLATPGINHNLRRDFCRLWNTNIIKANLTDLEANRTPIQILSTIHRVFVALHGDEPAEFTYGGVNDGSQMYQMCLRPDHLTLTPPVSPVPTPTRHNSAPVLPLASALPHDEMGTQMSLHKRRSL